MTSASASAATMAAAGFDKRPMSSLQTPGSGAFPSELLSPMATSPGLMRREELRTPITPPSAYLDFLRNMSPAMLSPAPTSAGSRMGFGLGDIQPKIGVDNIKSSSAPVGERPILSPPASLSNSQPPLSRNGSTTSVTSSGSSGSDTVVPSSASSSARQRPESPRIIIPGTSFARPRPPQPRRLHIPASPRSAQSGGPQSACATPWSASFSPRHEGDGIESMSRPGKVSVRQVVTRTVTYCRTPLEPAPKGKRRRLESEAEAQSPPAKALFTDAHHAAIKLEPQEELVEEKSEAKIAIEVVAAPDSTPTATAEVKQSA